MILSFWLAAYIDPWNGQGYAWKHVIITVGPLAAVLIGISRIPDGRHNSYQVLWGLIMGLISAPIGYLSYFPAPWSPSRGIPYCVRDALGMPKELLERAVTAPVTPDGTDWRLLGTVSTRARRRSQSAAPNAVELQVVAKQPEGVSGEGNLAPPLPYGQVDRAESASSAVEVIKVN